MSDSGRLFAERKKIGSAAAVLVVSMWECVDGWAVGGEELLVGPTVAGDAYPEFHADDTPAMIYSSKLLSIAHGYQIRDAFVAKVARAREAWEKQQEPVEEARKRELQKQMAETSYERGVDLAKRVREQAEEIESLKKERDDVRLACDALKVRGDVMEKRAAALEFDIESCMETKKASVVKIRELGEIIKRSKAETFDGVKGPARSRVQVLERDLNVITEREKGQNEQNARLAQKLADVAAAGSYQERFYEEERKVTMERIDRVLAERYVSMAYTLLSDPATTSQQVMKFTADPKVLAIHDTVRSRADLVRDAWAAFDNGIREDRG